MNNQNKINNYRRLIMRGLTKNVGVVHTPVQPGEKADFKRILIIRPNNRLGNLILITPLLQELTTVFPDCETDLFVRGGLAPVLFKNYPNIGRIIELPGKPFKKLFSYVRAWFKLTNRRYDLVINVIPESSSGRLATGFARSRHRIFGNPEAEKGKDSHVAATTVQNIRDFLALFGIDRKNVPIPVPDIKLDLAEIAKGKQLLQSVVPGSKPVISIFTYATGQKCYLPDWWKPFYDKLQQAFPGYTIVEVLPAENVSQIDFQAPSFYSRNIRDIGGFLANTALFIGADSGIMHLANASGTPTVGLFRYTKPKRYAPYGNGSLAIDTNKGAEDEWLAVIAGILEKSGKQ